jgi:excisionase family DNA binding protein
MSKRKFFPGYLPPFLTVAEYADLTRTNKNQVYLHIQKGLIPALKIGSSIRIPREALTPSTVKKGATNV